MFVISNFLQKSKTTDRIKGDNVYMFGVCVPQPYHLAYFSFPPVFLAGSFHLHYLKAGISTSENGTTVGAQQKHCIAICKAFIQSK